MPVPAVPRRTGPPRKKSTKATVPVTEVPKQESSIPSSPVNKVEESTSLSEDLKADQTSINLQAGDPIAEQKPVDEKIEEIHMTGHTRRKTESEDEPKIVTTSESSDLPPIYGGVPDALESVSSEIRSPPLHATEKTKAGDGWEGDTQIQSLSSTSARNTALGTDEAETDELVHRELLAERLSMPGVVPLVTPSPYEGGNTHVPISEHDFDSDGN